MALWRAVQIWPQSSGSRLRSETLTTTFLSWWGGFARGRFFRLPCLLRTCPSPVGQPGGGGTFLKTKHPAMATISRHEGAARYLAGRILSARADGSPPTPRDEIVRTAAALDLARLVLEEAGRSDRRRRRRRLLAATGVIGVVAGAAAVVVRRRKRKRAQARPTPLRVA